MVLTVPPIRKSMGWKPAEKIPTTYPRECAMLSRSQPAGPTRAHEKLTFDRI